MDPCQTINSAVPNYFWVVLFFFSYSDINSEGNFSSNFCSCLVILARQSLMSHLILSQGLGSVMPVKTCQLSNHSSSQPRSRKNVCSWMMLLPQIAFVSCFTKLSSCNTLRLWRSDNFSEAFSVLSHYCLLHSSCLKSCYNCIKRTGFS